MDFRLILDIVIALLLIATIGYAVTLNNRLMSLRRNRDDLAKTIAAFNDATLRAESSIPKLRRAADEAGNGLQERVEKAQSLRDDLAFMIERADTMANRLENSIRSARTEAKGGGAPSRPHFPGPSPTVAPPVMGAANLGPSVSPLGGRMAHNAAMAAASASGGEGDGDDRSEAERELLRALQSMR